MRFIVQNVAKRSTSPSARVTLGGRALPYGATRVILGLTDALAKELNTLLQEGVVEVACGGKYLDASYFAAAPVVADLPAAPPAPAEPVVEEIAPSPEVAPEVAPEVEAAPEVAVAAPSYTEEALNAMKAADLRAILEGLAPGTSAGKLKAQLVQAIIAAQGA